MWMIDLPVKRRDTGVAVAECELVTVSAGRLHGEYHPAVEWHIVKPATEQNKKAEGVQFVRYFGPLLDAFAPSAGREHLMRWLNALQQT
jgi:hypothetical protein